MLSELGKVSTVPRMCTQPQRNLSVEFYVQLIQFANVTTDVNESLFICCGGPAM
jgi:hypothetical protein